MMKTDAEKRQRPGFHRWYGIASFLILCLFLMGTEYALNFLGRKLYRYPWPESFSEETTRAAIWCLGDSHTQGAGAPIGLSYPSQLESRFRQEGLHEPVLNLGFGAGNSSEMVYYLKSALSFGRPRVLIFMGGVNNSWRFARVEPNLLWKTHGLRGVATYYVQKSRICQVLVNYVIPKVRAAFDQRKKPLRGIWQYDPIHLAMLAMDNPSYTIEVLSRQKYLLPTEHLLLGGSYFVQSRYREAFEEFDKIKDYPFSSLPFQVALLRAEAKRLMEGRRPEEDTVRFYEAFQPTTPRQRICYWLGRGWVNVALGKYAEARKYFVLANSPVSEAMVSKQRPLVNEALGWSYLLEKNYDASLECFNQVPFWDRPSFFWSFVGSAWVAAEKRDRAAFRKVLSALSEKYPASARSPIQNAWIHLIMMRWYRQVGDRIGFEEMKKTFPREYPLETFGDIEKPQVSLRDVPAQSLLHQISVVNWLGAHDEEETVILEHDLKDLLALSREKGFKLVLMGYPLDVPMINQRLSQFARERGLVYIDLFAEMGDIAGTNLISEDRVHPNAEGYRRIADHIYEELKKFSY